MRVHSTSNIQTYQFINSILDSFDLRNSSEVELRKDRSSYAQNISIFLKGQPIMSSVIYNGKTLGQDLIDFYSSLFQDSLEDLKPVSRNPRARRARDLRDSAYEWMNEDRYYTVAEDERVDLNDFTAPDPNATTTDRVLSELLPNYSIDALTVLAPWHKDYDAETDSIKEPEVVEYNELVAI